MNMKKPPIIGLFALFLALGCTAGFADSLFRSTNPITSSMFSDRRARNIGDIITIQISEASNSAHSNKTQLSKKSTMAGEIKSFLFPQAAAVTSATDALYAGQPYTGSLTGVSNGTLPKSDWKSDNSFEGDGSLASSDTIKGSITAMIIDVLPNGNFLIEGKRQIKMDEQERVIMISGIVRPEDIGAYNTVLSKHVADARIAFSGEGPVSDQQKRGLLGRLWDWLGLY